MPPTLVSGNFWNHLTTYAWKPWIRRYVIVYLSLHGHEAPLFKLWQLVSELYYYRHKINMREILPFPSLPPRCPSPVTLPTKSPLPFIILLFLHLFFFVHLFLLIQFLLFYSSASFSSSSSSVWYSSSATSTSTSFSAAPNFSLSQSPDSARVTIARGLA